MARTVLRLRTTKAEHGTKSGTAKSDAAQRTWRIPKLKRAPKSGPEAKSQPAAKSERGAKAGRKAKRGAKAGRAARSDRGDRRPLPFPLRLLAMLCAFAFMVAFAVVLARVTLEPSPASAALTHTNLHPGSTLRAYLDQPALRDAVKQIGGNLLLGVPFGVLVPVVAPGARGVLRVLLLTAVVMLLVEFAQGALVTGRAFDIDDVILNTTGALLGYLILGRRLSRAVHAHERR